MLIEIDDAGTGSPVGGIVIGARKGDHFTFRVIPVDFFRNHEKRKIVKMAIVDVVKDILEELEFNPDEDYILICQGDIFSKVHEWLRENGYRFEKSSIDSRLQDYVETIFDAHLTSLGVPRNLIRRFKDYKDYTLNLFKWALVRKEYREKYVKKVFRSWEKIWSKAFRKKVEIKIKNEKYCINCGSIIERGSRAYKIIISTDTRRYVAYSHIECLEEGADEDGIRPSFRVVQKT